MPRNRKQSIDYRYTPQPTCSDAWLLRDGVWLHMSQWALRFKNPAERAYRKRKRALANASRRRNR